MNKGCSTLQVCYCNLHFFEERRGCIYSLHLLMLCVVTNLVTIFRIEQFRLKLCPVLQVLKVKAITKNSSVITVV